MELARAYRAERAPVANAFHVWQQPATHALRAARVKLAWEAAGGEVVDEYTARRSGLHVPEEGDSRVRLVLKGDDDPSSALDGDFSERDRKELAERANRDGVWGVCGQFWNGRDWEEVDSCWGFIGDDWKGSGYDVDIMGTVLDALEAHDAALADAMEAARPDLYA